MRPKSEMTLASNSSFLVKNSTLPIRYLLLLPSILLMLFAAVLDAKANPYLEIRNIELNSNSDQVGDNADNCPNLSNPDQLNTDGDNQGNACDLDDDNDGFSDEEELAAGTDPLSASSCPGCFNWDIDDDGEALALTDGLMMIRHMFGFGGESLSAGVMGAGAGRATPDAISSHLTGANAELDVDGDGESMALTDGLLLIRYLFGFSGDSLISGVIGNGAERDTAEEVEAYIEARLPASP